MFGQMDEPPGTRLRVALAALTMAEYFRDVQRQDVLLFIDNIFRFTQAGSEVSTLLGRMPSAVGYQPNLADEMGVLQERITSTRGHSITSMQAIYVPADDYTDPAPATTFAHLDATTELSRDIAVAGHLPGGRPADLDVADPGPAVHLPGALRHGHPGQADPAAQQGTPGHHRDPRYRRASEEDKITVARARKLQRFLSQNTFVAKQFTGIEGSPSRWRTPSRPSRRSATASTTTWASRRSSSSAVWTTWSASGRRSRRNCDRLAVRGTDVTMRGLPARRSPGRPWSADPAPIPLLILAMVRWCGGSREVECPGRAGISPQNRIQGENEFRLRRIPTVAEPLHVELVAPDRTVWSGEATTGHRPYVRR